MNSTGNVEGERRAQAGVQFSLLATADPKIRGLINERLDAFNVEQMGGFDNVPLDVVLRDDADSVIGGLVGRTSLGVLFVDYLFVPTELRGQGHGGRTMDLAEQEARRRGCRRAVLFTLLTQAPAFYEKLGYHAFGRIDCEPHGNARVFMTKELSPGLAS